MEISVVVPAYNEEGTIKESVERTASVLKAANKQFEIIVVDDGSKDSTRKILDSMKTPQLVVLKNPTNMGKSESLNWGFAKAKGDIIILMDADLQQVPEDIPLLLKKMDEGYDVVNGWRQKRNDPTYKLIMSRMYNGFSRLLFGTGIHDMNCGFKAIRKKVLDKIVLRPGFFRYISALAKMEGYKTSEVVIRHYKREKGESKYGIGRVFDSVDMVSIKMKSMFSKRPMLLFGSIGGIVLLLGLVAGGYLAVLKFGYGEAIGSHLPMLFFTTMATLGGVLMISLGFLSDMIKDLEYRIDKESKKKNFN